MASHILKKLLIISTTSIGLFACNNHGGTNDYNANTSSLQSAKMLNSNDDDDVEAPTFTWVSGESNIVNVQAVAKTRGVADIKNTPGNRIDASMWADRDGNIWLFGGYYTKITNGVAKQFISNAMWKYDTKAKTWTWISGDIDKQIDVNQGTGPAGRVGAITWIDENDDLWVYGGYVPSNAPGNERYVRELWKFSTSKDYTRENPWEWVSNFSYAGTYDYNYYTPVSNKTKQTNPVAAASALNSRAPSTSRSLPAVTYADGVLHMFGGSYGLGLNDFWHYNPKGFDGIPARKWTVDEPTEYIPNPYKPTPEEFKDFKAGEHYLANTVGNLGSYGVLDDTLLRNNLYPNLSLPYSISENNYPSARSSAVLINADQPNTFYLYGGDVDLVMGEVGTSTYYRNYSEQSRQIWKYSNGTFDLISGCLGYVNPETQRWEESDSEPYSKKCVGDWQHAPVRHYNEPDFGWSDSNGNLWVWNKGRNLYMFDIEKHLWSQVIKDKDQTTRYLPGIYGTKNVASVNNRLPANGSRGVQDFEGNYWVYGGWMEGSGRNYPVGNALWKISVHSKSKPAPDVKCDDSICLTPLSETSHTWRDSFMEIPLEVRFGLKGYTITNSSAESVTQIKLNTLFPNDDFSIDTTYSNCVDGKGVMVTKLKPKQSCDLVLRYHPMEVADGDFSLSVVGITELSQKKLRSKSVTIEYSTLAGPDVPLQPHPAVKDEAALTMCDTQNDPSVPFKPIPAFNHKLCVKSIEPGSISWRDSLRDIPFQVDTNGKVNSRIGKKGLLITNTSTVPNEVISQIKLQDFPSSDFSIDYSMSSCFSYTPSIQSVHLDPGHSCTIVLKFVPTKELKGRYGFSIKGSALNNTAVVYSQYLDIMYSSYKLILD